jgi:hypothetical protein
MQNENTIKIEAEENEWSKGIEASMNIIQKLESLPILF